MTFTLGDAYHLAFDDNTFDIVHAHALLIHLNDPDLAIKEFARVVKPGGVISLGESCPAKVVSLKPDLPALRDFWAFCLDYMPKIGMHVLAGEQLPVWAAKAGFVDGEHRWRIQRGKYNIPVPSHTPRVTGKTAEMTIEKGLATAEQVEEWRKAWETWEQDEKAEFIWDAGTLLMWKPHTQ